jgi:cytochrome P450
MINIAVTLEGGETAQLARAPVADWVTVEQLDRDPYPVYARLREEAPVAFVPAVNVWMVTRWADVERAAGEPELFTATAPPDASPIERTVGRPTVLTSDGPLHRDMRASIDPKFRPREVDSYVEELVRPLAVALLADIAPAGEAELMSSYLEPVSVLSLGSVLGLADVDADTLRRWFAGLATGGTNYERDPAKKAVADDTVREIRAALDERVERLRHHPDDSAISQMLHAARPSGSPRTLDEIMPNLLIILLGGMQEPGHGAGSVLWALLEDGEATREVLADRSLIEVAVDEGLRLIAPIGSQLRASTEEVSLGGAVIGAGEPVALMLSSANRDAARFEDPDSFRLHRPRLRHGAFGFGRHFCSGHRLARQQIRIALEVLLEELPGIELDPQRPAEFRGWEFRAPAHLHARWR